ncbi:MAG: bifunctional hydroxymethylpyrimidine kinase/phosphomethylpyrimidine kinase [Pseudomonadota bacterium]|jgi:hydroxymethylpyrimidine/phosphomethylpyrimidine kinase
MPDRRRLPPSVLTIAGSDSGGGAGIQADLKTFAAHGIHGLSVLTAVTAQNTRAVSAVHPVPVRVVHAQVEAVFDDFDIRALKIGMLGTPRLVMAVASALVRHPDPPVVLDPVMVASSGATLLRPQAIGAMRRLLVPRATLLTPNLPEAELLLGRRIAGHDALQAAAADLLALGCQAVLLKGGHAPGSVVRDLFLDREGNRLEIRHRRLRVDGHGTGCTLSAAVAARLAQGAPLPRAVAEAADYVHGALREATRPGRGKVSVLAHGWRQPRP